MKILIVDDNKQNLLLLEAMLKGGGHAAVSAGNGIEALEILGKEKVDMIISDILMPGMDGFKLCMKCKEDEKLRAIPFIFTTSSYTEAKDEEFGRSLGAEAFIVRPIEPEEFIKKIGEMFRKKKEKKEAAPVELRQKDAGFIEKYSERLASQLEHKIVDLEKEVTERKRVEHDLKERVKELKCIAEISRLAEQPGISVEEFVEKSSALLPSAWQYPEDACAQITLDGEVYKSENFKETSWSQSADLHVDGQKIGRVTVGYLKEKPVADEGPFLKEEKELIGVVADFLSHVIQHRRTEKEIRGSEEKWRSLAANAPDIILNVDRASKILFINRTLPGFTVEGTIGKSVYDFTAPENHEMIKRTIEKVFSTGEVADYETVGSGAEGKTVWYSTRVGPIKSNGEVVSAILVSTDITERKQAEEEHNKHVAELKILAKATTGRELKMIELEKEINALLKELGREPRYKGV